MRPLRLAPLALACPLLLAAAPDPASPAPHACPPARPSLTAGSGRARARRLGDLPPASAVMLIDRFVDGCPAPLVVRTGIGFDPAPPETRHARE